MLSDICFRHWTSLQQQSSLAGPEGISVRKILVSLGVYGIHIFPNYTHSLSSHLWIQAFQDFLTNRKKHLNKEAVLHLRPLIKFSILIMSPPVNCLRQNAANGPSRGMSIRLRFKNTGKEGRACRESNSIDGERSESHPATPSFKERKHN